MDDLPEIQRFMGLLHHGTRDEQVEARTQLGEVYVEREQWDLAAECFERNIRDGVRTPELLGALGIVRIEQGRVSEGHRLIHEACELADKEARHAEQAPRGAWHWLVDRGMRPFRLAASMIIAAMGRRRT